jgi:hypothetical protein
MIFQRLRLDGFSAGNSPNCIVALGGCHLRAQLLARVRRP